MAAGLLNILCMVEWAERGDAVSGLSADQRRDLCAALSPPSLACALWKRRVCLATAWLLITLAAFLVADRLPNTYRSEALVLVESQEIPEKFVAAGVQSDLRDRLSTVSQRILSHDRLLEVIQRLNLYARERRTRSATEVVALLRENISILPVPGWNQNRTCAFRVACQGPSPAAVAQVANQLVGLFIEQNLKTREAALTSASEFLEEQLTGAQEWLEEQETELLDYKLKYGGELPQQQNALLASLGRLQTDAGGVEDAMERARQEKALLQNRLRAALTSEVALAQLAEQSAARPGGSSVGRIADSRRQQLQDRLDLLATHYSENHPDVQRLKAELARLEALGREAPLRTPPPPEESESPPEAEAPATRSHPSVPAEFAPNLLRQRERVESHRSELAVADRRLEALQREHSRLGQEAAGVGERLRRLPLHEQELARVMRDYEASRGYYQSLLGKKLAADLAAEMERRRKTERFTILEPAPVPEQPVGPNRGLVWLLGSFGGLAVGLVLAFGKELRANTVLGEWELPGGTPILGRVPRMGAAGPSSRRKRPAALILSLLLFLVVSILAAGLHFGWGGL